MVDQAVSNPAPTGVGVAIVNYKNEYVDVTPLLLEFNIYEDIFEHVMTCDVSLKDLTSVPEALPIVGDETIVIKYNTGIGSDQYILKFKCYKMNNRTPFQKLNMYILFMVFQMNFIWICLRVLINFL